MRHSAMLGHMLAAVSAGAVLSGTQQRELNSLIAGLPATDGKVHRSKVKPDRPRKKTNRGNLSARVRRRHRRS